MKKVDFTEMRYVTAGDSFFNEFFSFGLDAAGRSFYALRSFFLKGILLLSNEVVDKKGFGLPSDSKNVMSFSFLTKDGRGFSLAITKIVDAFNAFF